MNIIITIIVAIITFAVVLTYLSTFEWAIHRFPMHMKKLGKPWFLPAFRFLYKQHTQEHHIEDFPPTGAYEREDSNHQDITLLRRTVPLFWGIFLIGTATSVVWIIDLLTSYRLHLVGYCLPMATLYYILFETLHVAEHKPKSVARKLFGRFKWFEFLQNHHRLHHSKWGFNFNLVCPIADYLFGTAYKEGK